jgi:hypothetical protein
MPPRRKRGGAAPPQSVDSWPSLLPALVLVLLACAFVGLSARSLPGVALPLLQPTASVARAPSSHNAASLPLSVPANFTAGAVTALRPPPQPPRPRRLFVAAVVEDDGDAFATHARLALQGADVAGFVFATVPRTARGLRLAPPFGGAPLPPGCAGAGGAPPLCVAAELPPLAHGVQGDAAAARSWARRELLRWLAAWLARGGPPWGPAASDAVLLTRARVMQPPAALARLRAPDGALPVSLGAGPDFVYHLGWVAPWGHWGGEEAGGGCANATGGGEAWPAHAVAAAAEAAGGDGGGGGGCAGPPLEGAPGSARLRLMGGARALAAARARAPPAPSAQWSGALPAEAAALSAAAFSAGVGTAAAALIAEGVDARSGAPLRRVAGAVRSGGSEGSDDDGAFAEWEFSRALSGALRASAHLGCFARGEGCEGDAAPPPRLLFACPGGRTGNYFISVLHALGLAAATGRAAVLPAYGEQGVGPFASAEFAEQWQVTRVWLPAPASLGRMAELFNAGQPARAAAVRALCFASDVSGAPRGCRPGAAFGDTLSDLGGIECAEVLGAGADARPPHPLADPPMYRLLNLSVAKLVNAETHPVGVLGARAPAALAASPLPVLQDLNFYGFSFSSAAEFEGARCAIDFAAPILAEAWAFAGPLGPLRGEPFFSLHARLEDFADAFPGEDTAPPLDAFALHGARLARKAGLRRAFLTTNGSAKERELILTLLRNAGLEAEANPTATGAGYRPAMVDAAIAGFGAAFLGNVQSTFSWMVAHTLLCAGARPDAVHFFTKKAADALATESF